MKIAHVGASGNVGSKIVAEALRRGHTVTAIVRNPDRLAPQEGLTAVAGDVTQPEAVASTLAGHDAVFSSLHFSEGLTDALLEVVRLSGVSRLLMVGGAGSLKGPDGKDVVDSPDFPEAWKPEALGGREALRTLRETTDLDWTFVSPSALIEPGERTGRFRLGGDDLLIGEDGQSRISQEDFAIAFVDELENPRHTRARFTVGY